MLSTELKGVGLGLRSCHFNEIIENKPPIPWFEALSDNFMLEGGPALTHLETIRENYPLTLHGVGLSLGSSNPSNVAYLQRLKTLIYRYQPTYVSEHLCWSSIGGRYLNDLLPLPYTEEAAKQTITHIKEAQDYLAQPLLIENVSSYLAYTHSKMSEWEFLNYIAEEADCYILLDINNIYVSSQNHQFDAATYLEAINPKRVKEFHLAGFTQYETHLLDSHAEPVHAPVWELYHAALVRFGAIPTLIEWDTNIPKLSVLQQDADKANQLMESLCN